MLARPVRSAATLPWSATAPASSATLAARPADAAKSSEGAGPLCNTRCNRTCGERRSSRTRKADSEADFLTHVILHRSAKHPSYPTARSKLDIVVTWLLRSITHIAEIVVKNLTISYASRKPRVTYGRFAGDFERRVRQRVFESHVNTCEGKCVENAVALPSFAMTCFSNEMRVRAASGCS